MSQPIDQLVRPAIQVMQPIDWGEVPEGTPFRLMYGENQAAVDGYRQALIDEIDKVNLYPSGTKTMLREQLAAYNAVDTEQIVPTNGSDEALELIAKVFIDPGDEVVIPEPAYPCFTSVSQMMGATIRYVPLNADFTLDPQKVLAAVSEKTKVIWIANPNNPTGNLVLDVAQIETIAASAGCLVVVDECYFELAGITATSLIAKYPNIVITRSFSKVFALAGLRLGYLMASPEVACYLNRLQLTNQVFNVNRFALAAGVAILKNPTYIRTFVADFQATKQRFEDLLGGTPLQILPTKTTFCIARLPKPFTGASLKAKLAERGMLIKDCSIYPGFGNQYIYLGVPRTEYQQQLVDAIREALC